MKMFAIYTHKGYRVAHIPAIIGMGLIESGVAVKEDFDDSDEYTITDHHEIKKGGFTIILHRGFIMREIESDDYE